MNRYAHDNPLFEEQSLHMKLLRQLMAPVKEQNEELVLKHIDDQPLSTLHADRIFCLFIEDIGKKINSDVDLK